MLQGHFVVIDGTLFQNTMQNRHSFPQSLIIFNQTFCRCFLRQFRQTLLQPFEFLNFKLIQSWILTFWPMAKWNITITLDTVNLRGKLTEMWASGVRSVCTWAAFWPLMFQGHFVVIRFYCLFVCLFVVFFW